MARLRRHAEPRLAGWQYGHGRLTGTTAAQANTQRNYANPRNFERTENDPANRHQHQAHHESGDDAVTHHRGDPEGQPRERPVQGRCVEDGPRSASPTEVDPEQRSEEGSFENGRRGSIRVKFPGDLNDRHENRPDDHHRVDVPARPTSEVHNDGHERTLPRATHSPENSRYARRMATGVLALLGSGETGPGMTKVHRALLERAPSPLAVNLNTPYGFQENVPQMTEKLQEYFRVSLRTELLDGSLPHYESASDEERQRFRQRIREAGYVFAGPGSPSYALRQWQPLGVVDDLTDVLAKDGVVCFSSAAALTLGTHTAPIYEIYKVGSELRWLDGLGLTARLGLSSVVVPHYNNAEGGNYDTSRCYLGERRLRLLEELLEPGTPILGIDEHTACLIDFTAGTLNVQGKGQVHWRLDGSEDTIGRGETIPLTQLGASSTPLPPVEDLSPVDDAIDASEVVALRRTRDDLVALLDELRARAREGKDFATADRIRDALVLAGQDVRDSALKS